MENQKNTIAAIATPLGTGGIGIIRISGDESRRIAKTLFLPTRENFIDFLPYHLHHGHIIDSSNNILDEVLVSFMPCPGSYSGEDVVEINCHGGSALLQMILELILQRGARLAEPGEFSLRAFLNGKLDLTQAEAVIELINAKTAIGARLASRKITGALGEMISNLCEKLDILRAHLCLAVDFPEEELDCISYDECSNQLENVYKQLSEIYANYERNRHWRDGVLVVLAGKVNAGKSSLLNAFLGHERALVTEIPGTTRDYIEEQFQIDGLLVRLVDTAGVRESSDLVEQAGIAKSKDLIVESDLILLVVDATKPLGAEDLDIISTHFSKIILVLNKQDKEGALQKEIDANLPQYKVSAINGLGIVELCAGIYEKMLGSKREVSSELVPNLRQKNAIFKALQEIEAMNLDIRLELPYDLLSVRLDFICSILTEITGETLPDDILARIFESFCIGK